MTNQSNTQAALLMKLAAIAAECSDPDTTDALDALIAAQPTPEPVAQADELDPLRVEIASAWNDLPDNLRCHPGLKRLHRVLMKVPSAAPPAAGDEACQDCNGSGEVFTHAEDCADDLCALNGDVHSCQGQVLACTCKAAEAGKVGG